MKTIFHQPTGTVLELALSPTFPVGWTEASLAARDLDSGRAEILGPGEAPAYSPDGRFLAVETILILSSVDARGDGWLTTAGLRSFGLPELEIVKAPPVLIGELGRIINYAAQHVLDALRSQRPQGVALASLALEAEPVVRVEGGDASGEGGDDAARPIVLLRRRHAPLI